jgi:hypothetical protein
MGGCWSNRTCRMRQSLEWKNYFIKDYISSNIDTARGDVQTLVATVRLVVP